jgi:hypothetical protein
VSPFSSAGSCSRHISAAMSHACHISSDEVQMSPSRIKMGSLMMCNGAYVQFIMGIMGKVHKGWLH